MNLIGDGEGWVFSDIFGNVELLHKNSFIVKAIARKAEIVGVAAKLFRERGYSAVTMRDIAQAMDMRAASLYNHIESKQEILVLIVIEIAEEFTRRMAGIVGSRVGTIRKLEQVIELHIDITLRDSDALASLNNDWMHLADVELGYFIRMREEYEQNFRTIIKEGIAGGEIRKLNPEVIIFSTLSTLRTLYVWYGKKRSPNAATLKRDMTKVLLEGIV